MGQSFSYGAECKRAFRTTEPIGTTQRRYDQPMFWPSQKQLQRFWKENSVGQSFVSYNAGIRITVVRCPVGRGRVGPSPPEIQIANCERGSRIYLGESSRDTPVSGLGHLGHRCFRRKGRPPAPTCFYWDGRKLFYYSGRTTVVVLDFECALLLLLPSETCFCRVKVRVDRLAVRRPLREKLCAQSLAPPNATHAILVRCSFSLPAATHATFNAWRTSRSSHTSSPRLSLCAMLSAAASLASLALADKTCWQQCKWTWAHHCS